jgi:hypothetical protein
MLILFEGTTFWVKNTQILFNWLKLYLYLVKSNFPPPLFCSCWIWDGRKSGSGIRNKHPRVRNTDVSPREHILSRTRAGSG